MLRLATKPVATKKGGFVARKVIPFDVILQRILR
jgi:hypothetical protein